MFAVYQKLKELGIMGMNARNIDYIQEYNPRHCYPLVDNKLVSKTLAMQNRLAVPDLYAVVEIEPQVRQLATTLAPFEDFVIKPAHGSGGDGILVVTGRRKNNYLKANGELITIDELQHHVSNILSGMYSLGGHSDVAVIEYRVKFDPLFEEISYQGVPDVRMIVFQGYPVMGMLRLPTRMSHGKANLHQGAIGVGLDISNGKTLNGTWQNEIVDCHPDTGNDIAGLALPYWEGILSTSAGCYEMTGLGYLGVDLVLDRDKGPLMLELNARPGLSIQIANQTGLEPRLEQIKAAVAAAGDKEITVAKRVAFAKQQFAYQLNGFK